eukprot:bmy_19044T0
MAYDRYVAIFHPLHYSVLMCPTVCIFMVAGTWLDALLNAFIHVVYVLNLPYCGSREIHHFFCEIPALLKLVCADTSLYENGLFVSGVVFLLFPISAIMASYGQILYTVLRLGLNMGMRKTLATCSSHMIVVTLFYGIVIIKYFLLKVYHTAEQDKVVSIFYTILTPMLNPLIYSLRNRDGWSPQESLQKKNSQYFQTVIFSGYLPRWSSQVQFQMREEMKALLLVLAHSSINERDHDICAEEHMAMTVKCSSPEERLRGTLMVVWVSQQPQALVKLLNPQGSLVHTLRCAVGMRHIVFSSMGMVSGSSRVTLLLLRRAQNPQFSEVDICTIFHCDGTSDPHFQTQESRPSTCHGNTSHLVAPGGLLQRCCAVAPVLWGGVTDPAQSLLVFLTEATQVLAVPRTQARPRGPRAEPQLPHAVHQAGQLPVGAEALQPEGTPALRTGIEAALCTVGLLAELGDASEAEAVAAVHTDRNNGHGMPVANPSILQYVFLSTNCKSRTQGPFVQAMESQNVSIVTEFQLLGFQNVLEWWTLLFAIFLSIYFLTVTGNIVITTVIWYTSTIVPLLLANLLSQGQAISFPDCIAQLYFFVFFGATKCFLLAMMAYDWYLAICSPLRYSSLMSPEICTKIPSASGRVKTFAPCGSHLAVVTIYCGSTVSMYVCPNPHLSPEINEITSVFYPVVTPLLNPVIYSLRNKDFKDAVRKVVRRTCGIYGKRKKEGGEGEKIGGGEVTGVRRKRGKKTKEGKEERKEGREGGREKGREEEGREGKESKGKEKSKFNNDKEKAAVQIKERIHFHKNYGKHVINIPFTFTLHNYQGFQQSFSPPVPVPVSTTQRTTTKQNTVVDIPIPSGKLDNRAVLTRDDLSCSNSHKETICLRTI